MSDPIRIPEAFEPLFRPARYKASWGGRGSAKSHSFARALLVQAVQQPLRVGCFREIQLSIKDSVKRLLDDVIDAHGLRGFYASTENEIRGRNGSLFLFSGLHGLTVDKIKSLEGLDRAWVEEAQRVSQRSLDILRPTIRKPGSEIWFGWNPERDTDPVDAMFRGPDGPPPNSILIPVSFRDNRWFTDEMRADLEWDRIRDPGKFRHVWEGGYALNTEAQVFRNWRVEPFETPADAVFRFGADWGFANDPTVLVKACIDGRRLLIRNVVAGTKVEIDATPGLFMRVPGAKDWPITADSARPETISYMRRAGFKMREAIKGAGSIEEGVRFLQSFEIVVHPDCDPLMAEELANYSFKTDPVTGEVLPLLEDKWNNAIDALRYACEAVRRVGKPGADTRIPSRNPADLKDWGRREPETNWKVA